MGIFSDIMEGVRTTLVGLKVTVPYIWRRPVTLKYPHERLELPERARNRLYVNMDDCIGCDQCARACPVNCIDIETVKAVEGDSPGVTSNGKKKALWVTRFDIDIAKCCYCGLCTYPCPTECIKMTDVFEFAEQERNNLIYSYITLTPEEIERKIAMEREAEAALAARKAAAKASAAAAATPTAASSPAAPAPAAPGSETDPEKAAKIRELQEKMAAARAKKEGASQETGAAPASPASPAGPGATGLQVPADADAEKAAKIRELQEKMAAARAKKEGTAPDSGGAAPAAAPSAPDAGMKIPPGTDEEKAAKIRELQEKMAAARAKNAGAPPMEAAATPGPGAGPGAAAEPAAPSEGAASPAVNQAPEESPAPPAAGERASADDAEKEARIAALKAKIEAAKRDKGLG